MASGEIDVTPGRVLSNLEKVDNGKLNDLGRPILRVKEAAITSRELAPGSIDADKLNVDLEAQIGVSPGSVTTGAIVDGAVTSAKLSSEAAIPTGVIFDFAGTTPPEGWLLCYGQAISRATYSVLFGIIGTVYGSGDGSTTFNIPDLRGIVCAGLDNMGGAYAGRLGPSGHPSTVLGGLGGEAMHILTIPEMPSHSHNYEVSNANNATVAAGVGASVNSSRVAAGTTGTGSTIPHNTVQPTMVMNKIIKAT